MPADSSVNFSLLHRTCKLVVLLCFLHISVTVFFYVRSMDVRFAFVQNQQMHKTAPRTNSVQAPVINRTGKAVVVPGGQNAETPVKSLEKCPETSPLLGKTLRGCPRVDVGLLLTFNPNFIKVTVTAGRSSLLKFTLKLLNMAKYLHGGHVTVAIIRNTQRRDDPARVGGM